MGVVFSHSSNTVSCAASVARNLLRQPTLALIRDGTFLKSEFGQRLSHSVQSLRRGVTYTCSVCVEIEEANIVSYCNHSSTTISDSGR